MNYVVVPPHTSKFGPMVVFQQTNSWVNVSCFLDKLGGTHDTLVTMCHLFSLHSIGIYGVRNLVSGAVHVQPIIDLTRHSCHIPTVSRRWRRSIRWQKGWSEIHIGTQIYNTVLLWFLERFKLLDARFKTL